MIHGNRCNTLLQHGEGEKIIITKYKKQALRNLHKKLKHKRELQSNKKPANERRQAT